MHITAKITFIHFNSYLVSKTVWDTLLTKREHLPAYLLCSSFYHFNSAFSRTNIIDCQTHNDNYRWETTCPQSSHGTETRKGHWSCENLNNSYLVSKTVWDTLLTKREHLPAYLLCSSFYHFNSAFSRTNIIDCQTHNDNYRWETTCPQSSRGTETGKGHRSSENHINSYLVLKTVCNTLHTKREHSQKYLLCSSFYRSNSVFFQNQHYRLPNPQRQLQVRYTRCIHYMQAQMWVTRAVMETILWGYFDQVSCIVKIRREFPHPPFFLVRLVAQFQRQLLFNWLDVNYCINCWGG